MEKIFADGVKFTLPKQGTPDFVKGRLSIKVSDFITFLQLHEKKTGYVDIDLKVAKSGKCYAELNTWKPANDRPQVVQEAKQELNLDAWDEPQSTRTSPSEDYPEGIDMSDVPF